MRRVCRILAFVADHFTGEQHQAVWDALRAYTIVMQFENPTEIYERIERISAGQMPEQLKADLRRLWITPEKLV